MKLVKEQILPRRRKPRLMQQQKHAKYEQAAIQSIKFNGQPEIVEKQAHHSLGSCPHCARVVPIFIYAPELRILDTYSESAHSNCCHADRNEVSRASPSEQNMISLREVCLSFDRAPHNAKPEILLIGKGTDNDFHICLYILQRECFAKASNRWLQPLWGKDLGASNS